MLRDIYTRNEDDPKFVLNKIEESDMVDDLVQQLMMLFATSKGEVIAFPDYGINLEDLLFEFELDKDKIVEELSYQFSQYIQPYFPTYSIEFDLNVNEADIQRAMILDIYINSKLSLKIVN